MSRNINSEVKYRNEIFRIETKKNGKEKDSVSTILFLDKTMLVSRNMSYGKILKESGKKLKDVMKLQHLIMVQDLKDGKFLKFMTDEPVKVEKKKEEMNNFSTGPEKKIEEVIMVIKEILAVLEDVNGYMGSGVFTPQGEMLEGSSEVSGISFEQSGSLIHDILNKSKNLTSEAGFGEMHMIQLYTEMGIIIAVCTEDGDQHFHTILVLNNNGNVAMGKLKMEKVVKALKTAI